MSVQKVGMSFTVLCLGNTCMVQEIDRQTERKYINFEHLFTDLT